MAKKHRHSTQPENPTKVMELGAPSDRDDGSFNLRGLGGSGSKALNNILANQAIQALWFGSGCSEVEQDRRLTAATAALMEFKPTDGIEGMMAAQAVGLHSAAMECLRRAMIPDQPGLAADQLRRQSANLSRAFLDVLSALDRKRGKGARQIVRVERVMVASGGQAIVGNVQAGYGVEPSRKGVGCDRETEGEPHAPPARLAHDAAAGAILPPMRGPDPSGDAVPIASDEQRAMPDAWRDKHRS